MKRKGKTPAKRKIRLYRKTDRDLMMLYKAPRFSFQKAIDICLKNAAYGEANFITVPELEELHYPDGDNVKDGYPDKMEIVFDISDDAINEWIDDAVPMGKRNDFMKHLIRGYLAGPILFPYVANDDPVMKKINAKERAVISCERSQEEYESDVKGEMARLKKAMGKSGKTIDDLLSMLEGDAVDEAKKVFTETKPEKKVKAEEKPVTTQEKTEPAEADESFDLFGALANM